MAVEFDEFSRPVQSTDEVSDQPAEVLTTPGHRRRWVAVGTVAGAALVAGGVAIALTGGPASASPVALAAAAASSASSGGTPAAHPTGPDGRRGGPLGGGFAGPFGGQPGHPVLFGTVKSVSGATIQITDQQGFTRVIVTSSTTTYKDGLSAAPKVGTKIIAEGTVDANGTSLDATTISALPTPTGTPPSGQPKSGSGPGGFGPGGARPTGMPTGMPSGAPTGGYPGHRPSPTATPSSVTTG